MVSSKPKNGFNCVSCGTHRRWTSLRHVIPKREPRHASQGAEGMGAGSRSPHGQSLKIIEGFFSRKTHSRARGSSRNIRHEKAIGHHLLEMPDHRRLRSGDRDRQRLARGCLELDDSHACSALVSWPALASA